MKQVAKDVFQISVMPGNSINCYVIDDILVDAGTRSSHKKILNSINDRVINTHALTHAHADHQGSSSIICTALRIPLWCAELEKTNAESGNATIEYPFQKHFITKFQKKYWAGEGYPVSKTLKEGDSVGSFVVIATPGHSSGHISFFRERDGVLIVGDTMVNMNLLTTLSGLHQPPDLFTTSKEQNIQSIKKLVSLQPKILCFGHGPVLVNKGELEHFAKRI